MATQFPLSNDWLQPGKRLYFIGIGGISMCGLAELAQTHGMIVSGSDLQKNQRTAYLQTLNIPVMPDQTAANIDRFRPDAVIYTLAVAEDNPERVRARELNLPELERSVYLGLINRNYKRVINIAGTNGKTTTTAMCSLILMWQGLDPTVHLGAELKQFRTTVHPGKDNHLMVSEACEFGRSFLNFYSTTAAVLNVAHDHIDCFPTLDDVIDVFAEFVALLEPEANLVIPTFDPSMAQMLHRAYQINPRIQGTLNIFTFGYAEDRRQGSAPRLCCEELKMINGYPSFHLTLDGEDVGWFQLSIPGRFNVDNALAAIACAYLNGAGFDAARQALAEFTGAEGRFTETGQYAGARIIADYAHHPDSVKATIEAARQIPHKNFYAVFQPITFSRARGFFRGFVDALKTAEHALLVEIYDDREKNHTFSAKQISDAINEEGGNALFFASSQAAEDYLRKHLSKGDLAILMGQDIRQAADRLAGRSSHF